MSTRTPKTPRGKKSKVATPSIESPARRSRRIRGVEAELDINALEEIEKRNRRSRSRSASVVSQSSHAIITPINSQESVFFGSTSSGAEEVKAILKKQEENLGLNGSMHVDFDENASFSEAPEEPVLDAAKEDQHLEKKLKEDECESEDNAPAVKKGDTPKGKSPRRSGEFIGVRKSKSPKKKDNVVAESGNKTKMESEDNAAAVKKGDTPKGKSPRRSGEFIGVRKSKSPKKKDNVVEESDIKTSDDVITPTLNDDDEKMEEEHGTASDEDEEEDHEAAAASSNDDEEEEHLNVSVQNSVGSRKSIDNGEKDESNDEEADEVDDEDEAATDDEVDDGDEFNGDDVDDVDEADDEEDEDEDEIEDSIMDVDDESDEAAVKRRNRHYVQDVEDDVAVKERRKKYKKSVVDDEFFKLDEMNEFLEAEDQKEKRRLGKFDAADQMISTIEKYEEENLRPRTWDLAGEVTAEARDKDTLLDKFVDADFQSKSAPTITPEITEHLESIIKQRIRDNNFDDVERKQRRDEFTANYRAKTSFDETVRKSLADVYEEEFQAKQTDKEPDQYEMDPASAEITKDMDNLFKKMDALSHFQFAPPQVKPEVRIVKHAPSLRAEEVGPMASTEATSSLLAPEEVAKHLKAAPKSAEELDQTDRKRMRRKKKIKQKVLAKKGVLSTTGEETEVPKKKKKVLLKKKASTNEDPDAPAKKKKVLLKRKIVKRTKANVEEN